MPLHWQPPERPQRLPSGVTLDRRRAMGAVVFQPPPACPLRLRAVLDPWGAVLRTELHRRPHHPQVLPSQAILDRSRALAAMALEPECPLRCRAVLDRCRAVAAMALQRPPASAPTTFHRPRAARSRALQRPLACPLRLRAVLGRWRVVAAAVLQRQPLGRRRPPSRPLLERWAAAAMARLRSRALLDR